MDKAYGETRYTWGTMATDYRFTGQKLDSYINLYAMGARMYDPSLGRWISPDVIVPGTAGGSGGSAASLGYDDRVRLGPLTVGFHEAAFLAELGEENREIMAKGFWFQRSSREKRQSDYQWGPLNPQALNRYSYCLGNPLRYVDPTGHITDLDVELTPQEVQDLLAELDWWLSLLSGGEDVAWALDALGYIGVYFAIFGGLATGPGGIALLAASGTLQWTAADLEKLRDELWNASDNGTKGIHLTIAHDPCGAIGSWSISINGTEIIRHLLQSPKGALNLAPFWLWQWYTWKIEFDWWYE